MNKNSDLSSVDDVSIFYDSGYYDGEGVGYRGYDFKSMAAGFRSKLRDVKGYCSAGRLLDVGCTKGFFVKIALDAGYEAYGVDFSSYAINEAQKLVGEKAQVADMEKAFPFPRNSFDIITAWDFLEHPKDPYMFLCNANDLLKTNGYLFFTTVNHDSLMSRLMGDRWLMKGSLHISDFLTPKLLRDWLLKTNYRPVYIGTFMLFLKPLPSKRLEKIMSFLVKLLTPILRALNLGDVTYCIAQKTAPL